MNKTDELPIIQKTYDLILWYIPLLNRCPRDHKFLLGDRIAGGLYQVLEDLIRARYSSDKLARLETVNAHLDVLRHQTRLARDFQLFSAKRYEFAARQIHAIGADLGLWIRQQKGKPA